jgi:hypothetical protein
MGHDRLNFDFPVGASPLRMTSPCDVMVLSRIPTFLWPIFEKTSALVLCHGRKWSRERQEYYKVERYGWDLGQPARGRLLEFVCSSLSVSARLLIMSPTANTPPLLHFNFKNLVIAVTTPLPPIKYLAVLNYRTFPALTASCPLVRLHSPCLHPWNKLCINAVFRLGRRNSKRSCCSKGGF